MGIILRQNKGSELTFAEVDGNFQSLFYSSSISASVLSFFFPSSSVTQSVDLALASGDVSQIVAGSNITISPADGKGVVTINSTGGGGGSGIFVQTGSFYATTNDLQITGSLNVTGDVDLSSSLYVNNNITASGIISSSAQVVASEITASGNISTSAFLQISASQNPGQTYGVLVRDESTGLVYYTGSYGSGGSSTVDGIFNVVTGDIFGTTSSLQVTGSTIQQSPFTTTGANITASNAGTGGGVDKYAMTISQSVWHYTDNVGIPTSKAWKTDLDGSYFNNFDHNTDTAEILRFMAGLLSASAPDASPNTRTYASLGVTTTNSGTGTAPSGRVPQSSTNDTINYLQSKGFATAGQTIFSGISPIANETTYNRAYNSVAGGSTTVSSSVDSQLFGLGAINSAFNVSGSQMNRWADNSSKTLTISSASVHFLTRTGAGTSDGLTVGDISTGNPLIPDAFQDGKFVGLFDQGWYNGGVSLTSPSSSGYYYLSSSVGIQSGSSNYSTYFANDIEVFYAPTTQINTNVPTNTPTIGYYGSQSLTATSRSLSGAPYLATATWASSASITNAFDPLYAASSTFARIFESTGILTVANGGTGVAEGSTNGGTVQTSNFIYDSTGTTARTIGTIPTEDDLVKLTGSLTVDAGSSGTTNIGQATITPTTFTAQDRCRRRNGVDVTTNTNTYEYFRAGTFGQDAASGSMAYYGRAQGYDGSSLTGTTSFSENFSGEKSRIKINDNLLSGSYANGDKFTTGSHDEYVQQPLELQVKPGYLVEPGGTYGYWSPANGSSGDYIYYARAFQRTLGTGAGSVTMSLGTTLQSWQSTSDGVAAAILFESSGVDNYSTPRIFDPTNTVDNVISSSIANDGFKNPFTDAIALYGNVGGSISGNNYNIPLRNGDGMVLDGTDQDFIVIIRYKNDPTPVEDITITIA